jgi:aminoglycoside phosphotransferase (APT) family kinase protein
MDVLDKTRPVRPGEELPVDRLGPYLREALSLGDAPLEILQFPSGHSNLTYLIKAGERELVLRRPPFGSKVKSAHDMGREFRILQKLSPVYPRAPRPVLYCEDEAILGAKFYLMERVRGVILRRDPPAGLSLGPEVVRGLCEAFVDTLCELHALDYQAVGLGDLGNPQGYVERQVSGWAKRYQGSKTDDIPEMETLGSWLAKNIPESSAAALIHNDFKFDNLILDPGDLTRIRAILDWEMSTVGDPLMDLGTSLCYWIEAGDPELFQHFRFGPTALPGMFTRRELAESYAAKSGRDLGRINFYYCFGLFKTAVVAQQIYYRYKQGLTKDDRFATMIFGVQLMSQQAVEYTGRSTL